MPGYDVTIFTDASFHDRTGAAGWGAWLKSGPGAGATIGGQMKGTITDSTHAELNAIANALVAARLMNVLRGSVLVQCDSLNALGCIRKVWPGTLDNPAPGGLPVPARRKAPALNLRPAAEVIVTVVREAGIILTVRHVRGHRAGDGRAWVNRECDRIARKHMQARLATVRAEAREARANQGASA